MRITERQLRAFIREQYQQIISEMTRADHYKSLLAKKERVESEIARIENETDVPPGSGYDSEAQSYEDLLAHQLSDNTHYHQLKRALEKVDGEIDRVSTRGPSKGDREKEMARKLRAGEPVLYPTRRAKRLASQSGDISESSLRYADNSRRRSPSLRNSLNAIFEDADPEQKANLVFLIGPPAVGKSTYIRSNLQGYQIVNRDELVEMVAKESGVGTYDDMYARPPDQLKDEAGLPPDAATISAYDSDPAAKETVDNYLKKIKGIASNVPEHDRFGPIKPFDLEALRSVIVDSKVPPKFVNPFVWQKVDDANKVVGERLADTRNKAVGSRDEKRKNIAIDMVNMSSADRNKHRKDILKVLGEKTDDPTAINKYYNQIAVVFSPEEGYTPEMIEKIKKIAVMRQAEIESEGGSKKIPPGAYDRMFASYSPPSSDEGFSQIKYVGVPALKKLDTQESQNLSEGANSHRWQRLAGILKG